ncbi:MAG: ABC transporter ATP-binding protein [Gemmatimonadetes bacterium]|nr:ABC transporter ATP-binding protein [Gemmatimonadota bacterium]
MSVAIRASGIRKVFGDCVANRNASLEVATGEIHAVVGENGAGKSTLMRMIAGMYAPDAGTLEVNGRDVTGWSTREAIAAGVGMVHQHFMLVPTLTVAENLVLGQEPRAGLQFDRAGAEAAVRALCERTGLKVDPARRVADLTVGELQRVEILKVLFRGAKILILDEPTAVLSPPEVTELWKVLRALVAQGGTVVLITHKLDEVIEVSQRITVMRAGETVGQTDTAGATPASIARMMVGREVRLAGDDHAEPPTANPQTADGRRQTEAKTADGRRQMAGTASEARPIANAGTGSAALSVRALTVASSRRPNEVDNLSFEVRPGEIFGIAGVEGNGQTELIEAIAGLRPAVSGSVQLGGTDITGWTVRQRADAGLSHIPEDRHRRGLVLEYSIADDLILGLQHRFSRGLALVRDRIGRNADERITQFDVRPASATTPARALSGGNQQKVVIARELRGREFSVLLAVQPTRGVDVGAIEFIHDQLRAARNAGKAILLVSADLVEVLALSDRVGVMYGGRLVVTLPRAEASASVLGPWMTGAMTGGSHGGH